jgi:predicted porin
VQWSTDDFLTGSLAGGSYESQIYGVWFNYQLTERMTSSIGYLEEDRQDLRGRADFDRSLFQARLDANVGQRSNVYLLYQHEDTNFYYEDLYMAGIRRYF